MLKQKMAEELNHPSPKCKAMSVLNINIVHKREVNIILLEKYKDLLNFLYLKSNGQLIHHKLLKLCYNRAVARAKYYRGQINIWGRQNIPPHPRYSRGKFFLGGKRLGLGDIAPSPLPLYDPVLQ